MKDLRIGVVGCGARGYLARYAHRPEEGSRVVAVVDPDERARARALQWYGPSTAFPGDIAELRGLVDAVFVLSPDYLHAEHAVALLEDGDIAVYLEKPMAISVAQCDAILSAAKASGAKLFLGHNLRHAGFVLEMKRLIEEGAIGVPKLAWCRHFVGHGGDYYFKSWHADRRNVTGLLLQKGVHDIDILHWLGGGYTRLVTALGDLMIYGGIADRQAVAGAVEPWWQQEDRLRSWPPASLTGLYPVTDVEDASMMLMQLDNGLLASYQQCHFSPDYWRSYTVIGSEGRMENFGDIGPGSVIKVWNRRRAHHDLDGDLTINVPVPPGSHGGADRHIVDEFIAYVRGGTRPTTSPVGARQAVAAACAATESLRRGGERVAIPAMDQELAGFFAGLDGDMRAHRKALS